MNIHRLIKPLLLLCSGSLVSAVLSFASQSVMAKNMPKLVFGEVMSYVALTLVITNFFTFGFDNLLYRLYGKSQENGNNFVFSILCSTLVNVGIIAFSVWILYFLDFIKYNILYFVPLIFSLGIINIISSILVVDNKSSWLFIPQISHNASRFLVIALLVYLGVPLEQHINTVYFITSIIIMIISYAYFTSFGLRYINKVSFKNICKVYQDSKYYAISNIVFVYYSQLPILAASLTLPANEVSEVAISTSILLLIFMLPTVACQKLAQRYFNSWYFNDPAKLRSSFGQLIKLSYPISFIIMAVTFFSINYFMLLFFGPEYNDASLLVVIMSCSIPFRNISIISALVLNTGDEIKTKAKYVLHASIISTVIYFISIDTLGLNGAAVAYVVSELILSVSYYSLARRVMKGLLV